MSPTILLDGKTLQVEAHLKQHIVRRDKTYTNPDPKNFRLRTFLKTLAKIGKITILSEKITTTLLLNFDIYVVLTRIQAYEKSEVGAIFDFVKHGGNLLLMSNHPPLHKYDSFLANKFGVELENSRYWSGERGVYSILTDEDLAEHSIIVNNKEMTINSIVTNTTCSIISKNGLPVIYLSKLMVGLSGLEEQKEVQNIEPEERKIFGLSIDRKSSDLDIDGKVVIIADSGFIGEKDSTFPGYGLIEEGDNLLFIKRLFLFLS
ncbi:MAG: hypothetical protein IH840_08805 [Candidatus Heimdallarchaeota archaeon]|nr:hypothetical protein [Candidatus Heimdallarchaeota archaeon]